MNELVIEKIGKRNNHMTASNSTEFLFAPGDVNKNTANPVLGVDRDSKISLKTRMALTLSLFALMMSACTQQVEANPTIVTGPKLPDGGGVAGETDGKPAPTETPNPNVEYRKVVPEFNVEETIADRVNFLTGIVRKYGENGKLNSQVGSETGDQPIASFTIEGNKIMYVEAENGDPYLAYWNAETNTYDGSVPLGVIDLADGGSLNLFGVYLNETREVVDKSAGKVAYTHAQEYDKDLFVVGATKDGAEWVELTSGAGKRAMLEQSLGMAYTQGNEFMSELPEGVNAHFFVLKDGSLVIVDGEGNIVADEFDEKKNEWLQTISTGLTKSPDGTYTLQTESGAVTLNADQVSLDNEGKLIGVNGYVFDKEKGVYTEQSPLPAELVESAQTFFGEGFEIGEYGQMLDAVTGQEVPGMTITMSADGKTWDWKRTYEYLGNPNFSVTGTEKDIKVFGKNGLDMYAWKYENGEFVREMLPFDTERPGVFVELEAHSPQEALYEVMMDSSTDPAKDHYNLGVAKIMGKALLGLEETSENGKYAIYFNYKGMHEKNFSAWVWGYGYVPTQNKDGSWEKNKTAAFVVNGLGSSAPTRGLISWYGKKSGRVLAVEGPYLYDPANFSPYWKTNDRGSF